MPQVEYILFIGIPYAVAKRNEQVEYIYILCIEQVELALQAAASKEKHQ